jgi:hypothetical protein
MVAVEPAEAADVSEWYPGFAEPRGRWLLPRGDTSFGVT